MPHPPKGEKDWIELYKDNSTGIDLAGWTIEDSTGIVLVLKEDAFFSTPSSFLQIFVSNRLNNSGDTVKIKNKENNIIDEKSYDYDPGENKSFGRYPDGSGNWGVLISATANSSNSQLAPSQTPIPSATLTPSRTPTPVKNAKVTFSTNNSQSSAVTISQVNKSLDTPAVYSQDGITINLANGLSASPIGSVAGVYNISQETTVSGLTKELSGNRDVKSKAGSALIYFLISGGLISVGGGVYSSIRKLRKNYPL